MARDRRIVFLFFIGWLILVQSASVLAQNAEAITVNHVVPKPGSGSTELDVFFTVTDSNGKPIPEPSIDSATIQLLNGNVGPFPADINDPETPIYIALLLDTSGSMANVMDQVRTAAKSAIDNAPPNALFAIIPFNESYEPIQDFTDSHLLVKEIIDSIESENRGTCLYDAVFNAVLYLEEQINNPQARRAIILFTDGRDQLTIDNPEPCSRHTYDEVISVARPSARASTITPVHTIGIWAESEAELNVLELRGLAGETSAYSAIGNQSDLNELFQEIIAGLNSQLLARAQVFAQQGDNPAVLSVKLRNIDTPLTTTFNFTSEVTDNPPAGAINIRTSLVGPVENSYTLSLSIAGNESIAALSISIINENGTRVSNIEVDNPTPTLDIDIDAAQFIGGASYLIELEAVGEDGTFIANEDGDTVLAEHEFVHPEPPVSEPVDFTIQGVSVDFENGSFTINLNVVGNNDDLTFEGLVLDGNTGNNIHEFGPRTLVGEDIQEVLPEAIRLIEAPHEYRTTITLITSEGLESVMTSDVFEVVPPEQPGLITRVFTALGENPIYIILIVVVIFGSVGLLMLRSSQRKKNAPVIFRPPIDQSVVLPNFDRSQLAPKESATPNEKDFLKVPSNVAVKKPAPSLRLRVMQTNNPAIQQEKVVSDYPFTIGREDCDLNIGGDRRISRRHFEFTEAGNQIFVTDLGGRNGTFFDRNRLPAEETVPLADNKIIRLSSQTYIEVELLQ